MKKENQYVIGVDGGGTKTIAALANLKGKILKISKSGPSSPRNVGIKKATENIAIAIEMVLKKTAKDDGILSTFIGLPAIEEEFRFKREEIKKELLKNLTSRSVPCNRSAIKKKIGKIRKGKVIIDTDQIVAFRAGTNEKKGIVLIAGTGCVVHGWRKEKEVHVSGWGWLADEGSAFWVGQKAFQSVFQDLDDRPPQNPFDKIYFSKTGS